MDHYLFSVYRYDKFWALVFLQYSRDQGVSGQERHGRLLLLLVITGLLVITRRRSGAGRNFAQQSGYASQVVVLRYGTERLQDGVLLRVASTEDARTRPVRIRRAYLEEVWSAVLSREVRRRIGPAVFQVRRRRIRSAVLEITGTARIEIIGGGRSIWPTRNRFRSFFVANSAECLGISCVRVQSGSDHLRQRPVPK